ncbi:hypothetical protein GCM10022408_13990 [Hymenobacter fastidiosus]|uniref:Uncharacterized protein n=1 Tax=Hymenobacter fastidiosus TaxID=486264 RepID=A0ABP7RXS7_9BACT
MRRRGACFSFAFFAVLLLAAGWPRPGRAQSAGDVLLLTPPPDSLLLLTFRARRVGISTYAQQTDLQGSTRLTTRQNLRYRLLSEWLYDERGRPSFVREDYLTHLVHTAALGQGWQAGQVVHYEQSRANATRSGAWLARMGYQHRLRALSGVDTLSVARYLIFGGLGYDARNGRQDRGPSYGLEVTTLVYPDRTSTQPVAVRLSGTRANLGPRIWQRTVAEGFYERTFDAYSTGSLRLGYRSNRAEDYVPGNVQRIQSDTIATQLSWVYRLADRVSLRSDNALALPSRAFLYRQLAVESDTIQNLRYRQQELDTRQELRMSSRKLQFMLTFTYRERNRGYALDNNRNLTLSRLETATARERVKDITEKTTLWQSELTWLPQPRHAFTLLGTAHLLRVDTPSEENEQDRDEAQHLLRLTWTGRWAGSFRTTLAVGGEYRQFVFVKAAQSAENYADRLLHWEPGFTWVPGRFSLKSTYHLWVSYQVRDRAGEQLKNRANRVLEQQQNLSYQLSSRRLINLDYVRRENRVGLLNWPQFRESPLDTTITHDLAGGIRQGWSGPRAQSSLRLGYRFLEQRTHGRATRLAADGGMATLIYLRNVTRQQGPDLAYERRTATGFSLTATLWLQQLRTFYRYHTGQGVYAASSYTAEELARETSNLYPYFELAVNWRLGGWRR